ncbi:MAG TPA: SagB/ThcOx family dehydrogenase [Phycisphaerae bacterium]|nr:SagB/ThcOx family dehydrogenase [Phycisphaerae bacterium]
MTLLHTYQHGTAYSRRTMPPQDPYWRKRVEPTKSYARAGAPAVTLKRPAALPEANLWDVLGARRSHRDFGDQPMSQETLMLLIWAAQGITEPGAWPLRAAPSAGALYPVETYVCAARVDAVEPGVYHWELPEERLAQVAARADVAAAAAAACLGQDMVGQAPVTFVWSAVWGRSAQKYGDRALRYVYLDAGHLAENLHLAATALGLGACMIGAFLDDEMNALVGVDGEAESVVYAACVGTPASADT